LRDESHSRNLGAVKIATLEQMPVVASRSDLLLVLISHNHHLDVSIKVELNALSRSRDLADGCFGFFNATLSDKPPRRFGRKESGQYDGNRPDPLERKRNTVTPLSCVLHEAGENTCRQQATNDPTHIDPGCHVS
jgi:hypothetical protein